MIMDICAVNLEKLDLNLLRVMQAIAQEGSVTRAGQRLGLSQPAVSNALGRLRTMLGDPLFVRSKNGVKATERARRVVSALDAAMGLIRQGLRDAGAFEPETARHSFALLVSDLGEIVYLPHLMQRVQRDAPGVSINVAQLTRGGYAEALDAGLADLAVGYLVAPRSSLRSRRLFSDTFVCMLRTDHPAAHGTLTLERYLALSHVAVARRGGQEGNVTAALNALGVERRVTLTIPHFAAAPGVVAASDLVVTVPSKMVELYAHVGVIGLLVPFAIAEIELALYWHERSHDDPANRWLRNLFVELFSDHTALSPIQNEVRRGAMRGLKT